MPTKILAIDDSKTMRLAIKISFAAEDAEVTAVSKGSEAVARAKQMAADAVLVDAVLAAGEPSGYEVCQQLKADAETAHIPVLVLVSNQSGVDAGKLKSSGADGWLAKPFETQELIDKVTEIMAKAGKPAVARPSVVAAAQAPAPAPRAAPATIQPVQPAVQPARPAPAPAAATADKPAPVRPAAAAPIAASAAPVAAPARAAAAPAPITVATPPAGDGAIPIAIPIPFVSADAPTPGILERLRKAQGSAVGGLDPKVAAAIVALSREVVEQVVWEVVPELAEQIIREKARA